MRILGPKWGFKGHDALYKKNGQLCYRWHKNHARYMKFLNNQNCSETGNGTICESPLG